MRSIAVLAMCGFVLAGCGPATTQHDTGHDGSVFVGDPNADNDGDGFTPEQGDCNDGDGSIYPGAPEQCDGKDHDCDGTPNEPCDIDGDGYTVGGVNGEGKDCNDGEKLVNPGAFEVVGNNVDDNCDGRIDEVTPPCDGNINQKDAMSYAGAIELCGPWAAKATWVGGPDLKQHAVLPDFGTRYKPKTGANFIVLSSGIAADRDDAGYADPQPGTEFANADVQNPAPMNTKNNVCGMNVSDELNVHDYIELKLTLKVPTNAQSFSFNFLFVSAEYPEWVGSEFNDKFLALLDSHSYRGNISFDKNKNPITVNVGFFSVCDSAPICDGAKTNTCKQSISELGGTGYELDDGTGIPMGGGTSWLTSTAPVTRGETATLRFIQFDEGDRILDSAVVLDNFQWQLQAAGGPTTIQ